MHFTPLSKILWSIINTFENKLNNKETCFHPGEISDYVQAMTILLMNKSKDKYYTKFLPEIRQRIVELSSEETLDALQEAAKQGVENLKIVNLNFYRQNRKRGK